MHLRFEVLAAVQWGFVFKFLLMTNLMHFFMYLFISSLYMFRASQCSSLGDWIVLIHHLVWLVCVSDCLVCRPYRHTKQLLTQTNHTRWCINTIWSPDDEHCDAQNMSRDEINKYIKKASIWSLARICNEMHGQQNIKKEDLYLACYLLLVSRLCNLSLVFDSQCDIILSLLPCPSGSGPTVGTWTSFPEIKWLRHDSSLSCMWA